MEKFYDITGSKLANNYSLYWINSNGINELFKMFREEKDIKSHEYAFWNGCLYIIPSDTDFENFGDMFCKGNDDAKRFKKNSKINKEWIRLVQENSLGEIHKPYVNYWFKECYGRHSSQVFEYDSRMYLKFTNQNKTITPITDEFKEITGSEYYDAKEKYERSIYGA